MTMIMTKNGHTVLAQSMVNEEFWMAWGDLGTGYLDPWKLDEEPPVSTSALRTISMTKGAANTSDLIPQTGVIKIVSIRGADAVNYVNGTDFFLDNGQVNWSLNSVREVPTGATYTLVIRYQTDAINTLIHEVGRRRASVQRFVVEDPTSGEIVANGTRWRQVNEPSEYLYLSFRFESHEAVNTSIYQTALFINSQPADGSPPGKMYFEPAEIKSPGSIFMIENHEPFPRNSGRREIFEQVIRF